MATRLGEFMKNPFPGKQPVPKLSQPAPVQPLERAPNLEKPDPIQPLTPAPNLISPTAPVFEPAPPLSQPKDVPFEPAPDLILPHPAGFEPAPALSKPSTVPFEPPPSLVKPADVGPQPSPPLTAPTTPGFTEPPSLSRPAELPPAPEPKLSSTGSVQFQKAPALVQPAAVNDVGVSDFRELGNLAEEWASLPEKQAAFFDRELPRMLLNSAQRALPVPGNIDPELLPSTITTKVLNVANEKIRDLENKYGYDVVSNAGAKVSAILGSALGVNSAPDGAAENSPNMVSLRRINDDFRNDSSRSLTDLFEAGSRTKLKAQYMETISSDNKYLRLKQGPDVRYRSFLDGNDGLLAPSLTVPVAAKNSYFPFYLVDLRPDKDKKYRTVFFQPINLELSENFSPSWNAQNFMGRVDPVATYQNTTRNISISFKMVAFHPADLQIIYGKLKWLTSMVYPEYSANMRYKSGPIVKLRIGDIINASSPSVPLSSERPGAAGYITSLDYTYDKIWEIENDWQVPRGIDVSFGFTVLHELPVGVLDGAFGTVGSIDDAGIFESPQQSIDIGSFENDSGTGAQARNYVDTRGFRSVGPDRPTADNRGLDIPPGGEF